MRKTDKSKTGTASVPVFTHFAPAEPGQVLRFREACLRAGERSAGGIGTLGEKSLHATLKLYYDEHPEDHEVRVGDFVADVVGQDGIIEIQTRELYRLKRKLTAFLEAGRVTVVHPVEGERLIEWLDPETGELLEVRRSTKKNNFYTALGELYGIRELLGHPGLTVRLPLVKVRCIKLLDGRGPYRKQRATGLDIVPEELWGEAVIRGPEDLHGVLPDMGGDFTVKELGKALKLPADKAYRALSVLTAMGEAQVCGIRGRAKVYRITDK